MYRNPAKHFSKNFSLLFFLFFLLTLHLSCGKTPSAHPKIQLKEKISLNAPTTLATFILSASNLLAVTDTRERLINLFDNSGNLFQSIDLFPKPIGYLEQFCYDEKTFFWGISRPLKRYKKGTALLMRFDLQGKILVEKELSFHPIAIMSVDSFLVIAGKYNHSLLHQFDLQGKYLNSFIPLPQHDATDFSWKTVMCKAKDNLILASPTQFKIWLWNMYTRLHQDWLYRSDTNLVVTQRIGGRELKYRQKGIHDMYCYKNFLFISAFDHSTTPSKFWYDVIDLAQFRVINTVYTDFLYSFFEKDQILYVYHNFPEFEIYRGTIN